MTSTGYTQYAIRHLTRFTYSGPISESVMEARMQPRSDGSQRCLRFEVTTVPRTRVFIYQDSAGNVVHHFDIPNRHNRLTVTGEGYVEMAPLFEYPESLPETAWTELDRLTASGEYWDALTFSRFACDTERLRQFASEIALGRDADPLTTLRWLTTTLFERFEYAPSRTRVDSPIDEALETRAGVCQDFAHIMAALVRSLGIPCRYVSGYLAPSRTSRDRSAAGATHAWVEAWLPDLGWVGFDPTNNTVAGGRHIRVGTGRDYGDVPPTRGVFKGDARSELAVGVTVVPSDAPIRFESKPAMTTWPSLETPETTASEQQQQQQQQ